MRFAGITGKLMCSKSQFTAVKIHIVQPTQGFAAAVERSVDFMQPFWPVVNFLIRDNDPS